GEILSVGFPLPNPLIPLRHCSVVMGQPLTKCFHPKSKSSIIPSAFLFSEESNHASLDRCRLVETCPHNHCFHPFLPTDIRAIGRSLPAFHEHDDEHAHAPDEQPTDGHASHDHAVPNHAIDGHEHDEQWDEFESLC